MNAANKKYTVLLLSAPIGSGHKLAAEALQQVLAANEAVHVVHGNIFDFFPHFIGTVFLKSYLQMLQHFPWMYKFMYRWGNQENGSLWMKNIINGILAKLGRKYLENIAPDAVIATHATPAGIVGLYKRSLPHKLFLGAVITDFTVHKWWICQGVDTYFIADSRLACRLPAAAEIKAFGIPVRQKFAEADGDAVRQEFGWQPHDKVCLLLGGGEGLLPMAEIVAVLTRAQITGLQIVAVTGHNSQLERALQNYKAKNLAVYGFTERLPEIMAAADIVVSKAGGLTSAEVLSLGKKFIIYKPLPGQEEGNAVFLQQYYGSVIAKNTDEVADYVRKFSKEAGTAIESADTLRLQAAEKICTCVLEHIKKNESA